MKIFILALSCLSFCSPFSHNNNFAGLRRTSKTSKNINMGFRSAIAGFFNFSKKERTLSQLKEGIARFYDESSQIWLDVWGEHMHHGYYPTSDYKDHKAAQIDMIDRTLCWAYNEDRVSSLPLLEVKNMVDIGCGVGGSSRHIAQKFKCFGKGISLSPFQIKRAQELTATAKLSDTLEYQVQDAMNTTFKDKTFDLTWSMESAEHMPNKSSFVKELVRITAPGGRIIVVTWCHRELAPGESLSKKEHKLLNKINDAYYLPAWCPASTYVRLFQAMNMEDIRQTDWSEFIAPFWPAVFRSALVPRNFIKMIRTGFTVIKAAIASLWMLRGYQKGLVKFVLITAKRPLEDEQPM